MKKNQKTSAAQKKPYNKVLDGKLRYALPIFLMVVAAAFIVYGVFDEEINAVFNKAINLCRECTGIG